MVRMEMTTHCSEETSALMAWLDLGQDGPEVFAELGDIPFEFVIRQEHHEEDELLD